MKYFDTHAHYYDERFSEEGVNVSQLISDLLSENVGYIINVSTCPENAKICIEEANRHENMYTAIGIHPCDTRFLTDPGRELKEIRDLITDPKSKCVCLGEIGLDYHYPETDKERQLRYFEAQMKMADELGIPVAIHDRESHEDVMNVIRKFKGVRGVLHSFSGSVEMARELVSLGYMISFSGTLTFKNARKPKEVAAAIPKDRILIETDAPYLAPHPNRGKLNHSGYLSFTNATLAAILGITEKECASLTAENAKRFFNIK